MKSLFVFGGMPEYFNHVLNSINQEVEVIVIKPVTKGLTLGDGVYESNENAGFKIISLNEGTAYYKKPFFKGIKKVLVTEKPDNLIIGWPYSLQFIFYPSLFFYLKKNKIKVFLKEIPFNVPGLFDKRLDLLKTLPNSLKSYGIYKSNASFWFHKLLYWLLFNLLADHFLLYTKKGVEIIKSYTNNTSNITVTYNSINNFEIDRLRNTLKIRKKDFSILHVGRLVKWKNVDLIIKAISKLKDKYPLIELTIIGGGKLENELKAFVEVLSLEEHVKFKGSIHEERELAKYFMSSSLFIMGGMGGLSINQALSYGVPVICSTCDGTEVDLIKHKENGMFFKNDDSDDLALKIDEFFSLSAQEKESYTEKALSTIANEINLNIVVSNYLKAFTKA